MTRSHSSKECTHSHAQHTHTQLFLSFEPPIPKTQKLFSSIIEQTVTFPIKWSPSFNQPSEKKVLCTWPRSNFNVIFFTVSLIVSFQLFYATTKLKKTKGGFYARLLTFDSYLTYVSCHYHFFIFRDNWISIDFRLQFHFWSLCCIWVGCSDRYITVYEFEFRSREAKAFVQPFCSMYNVILMLEPAMSQCFVCYECSCCWCRSCSQCKSLLSHRQQVWMAWVLSMLELNTLLNLGVTQSANSFPSNHMWWCFSFENEFTELAHAHKCSAEFIVNIVYSTLSNEFLHFKSQHRNRGRYECRWFRFSCVVCIYFCIIIMINCVSDAAAAAFFFCLAIVIVYVLVLSETLCHFEVERRRKNAVGNSWNMLVPLSIIKSRKSRLYWYLLTW